MALMSEIVDIEPSSFEEAVKKLVCVDAMVEEYESIIRHNVLEVVSRPTDKSVVSSGWIYKVKQVVNESVAKKKVRFVDRGFS